MRIRIAGPNKVKEISVDELHKLRAQGRKRRAKGKKRAGWGR